MKLGDRFNQAFKSISVNISNYKKRQGERKAHELRELKNERIRLSGEYKFKKYKDREIESINYFKRKLHPRQEQRKVPDIMREFGL